MFNHEAILSCKNINLTLGKKPLIESLSYIFKSGYIYGILGANGSGKSTLLHNLCGLAKQYTGDLLLKDQLIQDYSDSERATHISLLCQLQEINFPISVFETVIAGRYPYLSQFDQPSIQDKQRVTQLLIDLDLQHLASRSILQLSGGERQRVFFAQSLCQDTPIQLFDEPFNHLDLHYQSLLQQQLKQQKHHQKTIIVTLHDVNMAYYLCDYILLLQPNARHLIGTPQELLTPTHLEATYQHPFIQTQSPYGPFFMAKPTC